MAKRKLKALYYPTNQGIWYRFQNFIIELLPYLIKTRQWFSNTPKGAFLWEISNVIQLLIVCLGAIALVIGVLFLIVLLLKGWILLIMFITFLGGALAAGGKV